VFCARPNFVWEPIAGLAIISLSKASEIFDVLRTRGNAKANQKACVMSKPALQTAFFVCAVSAALFTASGAAVAQTSAYADPSSRYPGTIFPPQSASAIEEPADRDELSPRLRRQIVSYSTREAPGTIIVDTPNTYLYYVLGNGQAVRYGIGVGRDGFRWSGIQHVARKQEWPDWHPPAEMVARQPYLPRFMAGGPSNPLGARALYLGNSIYRIHGTNAPSTIGGRVSSGCIRMLNEDVTDLYARVNVGTKVVVLPDGGGRSRQVAGRLDPQRSQVFTLYEKPRNSSVY
jgi:lipoprotein-anchoring transpeptidase ErfK/SrfK